LTDDRYSGNNETMVTSLSRCVWVLLSYRLPREPSTPRIAVWRRLRRLGAAQIGDGLVALPADARTQEQLEWLAEEIAEANGTSTLWRAELTGAAQERALIRDLTAARAAEYSAVAVKARAVHDGAHNDTKKTRELRSLRRELRQIQRRDFFPPVERDRARAEVTALAESLLAEPWSRLAAIPTTSSQETRAATSVVDS
jgi:hypothetical protein